MLRKHLLITLLLFAAVLFTKSTHAQVIYYGIRAGANFSDIGGSDTGDTQRRKGLHAGGFAGLSLLGIGGAETGAYYSQKGFVTHYNSNKSETITSYVDVPLVIRFNIFPFTHLFAGPQASFLLDSRQKTVAGTHNSTEGMRKMDFAGVIGVGLNLPGGVRISTSYDHGIRTIYQINDLKVYNRVVKISAGYKF
jgi:hypothetical protein